MARYDYLCPAGHLDEREYPMVEAPDTIPCTAPGSMILCELVMRRQIARPAALLTYTNEKGMLPPSRRRSGKRKGYV